MISTSELQAVMLDAGADLAGFGDISALGYEGFTHCVSLAVRLPAHVVRGIKEGPTQVYFEQYHALNAKLNALAELAAEFLTARGFRALAQTTTTVVESAGFRTPVPHKTCATRSGLGWIGKSALLVTPDFGPAVRLSSVLTDAPFDQVGSPIDQSRCGNCAACTNACPGQAIHGNLWDVTVPREQLVDVYACRKAARALAMERTGHEITLCGKCIEVCPYTQSYIRRMSENGNDEM